MTLLVWVVLPLMAVAVLMVLALLVLRVSTSVRERSRARERAEVWPVVLRIATGDPADVADAERELTTMPERRWDHAEQQIFGLLPKVAGETRARLVTLVRERGAAERARRLLQHRSVVARCRGAHHLGALRDPSDVPRLVERLGDRAFLVRRVALRALGSIGSSRAVPAILHSAHDPGLTRDAVAALQRIGIPGCDDLRHQVARAMGALSDPATAVEPRESDVRIIEISSIALGLIGDTAAVPVLIRALSHPAEGVQVESITALGRIGAPHAVEAVVRMFDSSNDRVRRAAARAVGDIGDPRAVAGLRDVLRQGSHLTSRAVAGALLRLGGPGRDALRDSSSPYAREALAVHELRANAR